MKKLQYMLIAWKLINNKKVDVAICTDQSISKEKYKEILRKENIYFDGVDSIK